MAETLITLISAHFIADFLLQPDWLLRHKSKIWGLLLHGVVIGAVTYLCLQHWTAWVLPLLIGTVHLMIDAVKMRCRDTWRSFCMDQVAHLISLVVIFQLCHESGWSLFFGGIGLKWMVLLAGLTLAVQGAGFLVGKVAVKLQVDNNLASEIKGLKNGGKLIGQLERGLIFLFIMIGQPGGIGFLVAAKSILRFSEAKEDQRLAEYVLIGTLLSFGLAIAAATLTRSIFGMV